MAESPTELAEGCSGPVSSGRHGLIAQGQDPATLGAFFEELLGKERCAKLEGPWSTLIQDTGRGVTGCSGRPALRLATTVAAAAFQTRNHARPWTVPHRWSRPGSVTVTGGGDRNGAKKGYEVEDGCLHGFWSGCFRTICSDAVCRFDVPRASRLPYLPRHGALHHSRPTPERALAATGDDFPHDSFNPKTFAPISTNSNGVSAK